MRLFLSFILLVNPFTFLFSQENSTLLDELMKAEKKLKEEFFVKLTPKERTKLILSLIESLQKPKEQRTALFTLQKIAQITTLQSELERILFAFCEEIKSLKQHPSKLKEEQLFAILNELGPKAIFVIPHLLENLAYSNRAIRRKIELLFKNLCLLAPNGLSMILKDFEQAPEHRKFLLRVLRQFEIPFLTQQSKQILKTLPLGLKDRKSDIRLATLKLMRKLGESGLSLLPDFILLLEDPNKQIQKQTRILLYGLSKYSDEVPSLLLSRINDPNPLLRQNVLLALKQMKKKVNETIPLVIPLLQDPNIKVAQAAVSYLGSSGKKAALATPLLLEIYQNETSRLSHNAQWALLQISKETPVVVEQLLPWLETKENKYKALWLLKNMGSQAKMAVPLLIPMLDSKSYKLRYEIRSTLTDITKRSNETIMALIMGLKDSNSNVRQNLLDILLEDPILERVSRNVLPQETVPLLIEVLTEERRRRVREDIVVLLGRFGKAAKGATNILIEIIQEEAERGNFYGLMISAQETLVQIAIETPTAIPSILALLANEEEEIRERTLEMLEEIGPNSKVAFPELIEALHDEEPYIRRAIIRTLGKIAPHEKAVLFALITMTEDEEIDVCQEAIRTIALLGGNAKEARSFLIGKLKTEHPRIRQEAAIALSEIGVELEEFLPEILKLLSEENSRSQDIAFTILGKFAQEDFRAFFLLCEMLEGPEVALRQEAIAKLRTIIRSHKLIENELKLKSDAAILSPYLIQGLKDSNRNVRINVVNLIGELGERVYEAIPYLILNFLKNDDFIPKDCLLFALGSMGKKGQESIPFLLPTFKHASRSIRYRIVWSISRMEITEDKDGLISFLLKVLKDKEGNIRWLGVEVLRKMGPNATIAIPALKKCLFDKDTQVRENAKKALKAIQEKEKK